MSPPSDARSPVELLAEEFLARCKRGEKPTIKEYCDRHPALADEIRDVFEAVMMVEDLKPGSEDASVSFGDSVRVNGRRLEHVGDYRILGEIGRGGMGVVYEAEQQALGRRVALKVLPKAFAGGSSAQVRFQREAKAAARMHHTNIVPVFDVGQDGDHLYYAMQLIHGQGLDLVIDDLKRLRAQSTIGSATNGKSGDRSIAASLANGQFEQENLAPADDTQQTAAYQGSAPSSAMLPGQSELSTATSNRGAYFRSVAEIGLQTASALSYAHSRGIIHRDIKPGNLILDTAGNVWVTDFGVAKTGDSTMTHTGDILGTVRYMSPERFRGQCDVRADVYALGMTLYEMLTLKAAYASNDRLKLIELIRQTEAPSARSVDSRIPLDLETIVMKAIDKDPKARYQSADEMAEDLQRFVKDEPIKARRISRVERFTRWCRRYPAVAGLTATVMVLMAVGTTISTWQAIVATKARTELAAKNEQLAAEQDKVQARFDTAVKAIETFHTGVSKEAILKNPQLKGLRTKLLKEAAGFYADLEKLLAGQTDVKARKTLAAGYYQLAELMGKIEDNNEALRVHRLALAMRRELAAAPGADVESRLDVACSLWITGCFLLSTGETAEARLAHEEQRDIAERLEALATTDAIRVMPARKVNPSAASTETIATSDAVRSILAHAHHCTGNDFAAMEKFPEALEAYGQALAIYQKLADANPTCDWYRHMLAGTYQGIGNTLAMSGKPAEGLESFLKASKLMEKMSDANRSHSDCQTYLANGYGTIGFLLLTLGKPMEAVEMFKKGMAIWQKLADDNPAVDGYQLGVGRCRGSVACVLLNIGKPAEALEASGKALAIFKKLVDENPTNTWFRLDLANFHANDGRVMDRLKRYAEAVTALEAGLTILQKLAEEEPNNNNYRRLIGWMHGNRGGTRVRTGRPAEAAADLRRALELWAKVPNLDLETQVEQSRVMALLVELAGNSKSGVTAAEAKTFADQSIANLATIVKTGWALPCELKEPDFDAVRGRADFQKLFAEVEAKAEKPLK